MSYTIFGQLNGKPIYKYIYIYIYIFFFFFFSPKKGFLALEVSSKHIADTIVNFSGTGMMETTR